MKKIDLMIASIIDGRESYECAFDQAVKKARAYCVKTSKRVK